MDKVEVDEVGVDKVEVDEVGVDKADEKEKKNEHGIGFGNVNWPNFDLFMPNNQTIIIKLLEWDYCSEN